MRAVRVRVQRAVVAVLVLVLMLALVLVVRGPLEVETGGPAAAGREGWGEEVGYWLEEDEDEDVPLLFEVGANNRKMGILTMKSSLFIPLRCSHRALLSDPEPGPPPIFGLRNVVDEGAADDGSLRPC
jgi:hypothetical protein